MPSPHDPVYIVATIAKRNALGALGIAENAIVFVIATHTYYRRDTTVSYGWHGVMWAPAVGRNVIYVRDDGNDLTGDGLTAGTAYATEERAEEDVPDEWTSTDTWYVLEVTGRHRTTAWTPKQVTGPRQTHYRVLGAPIPAPRYSESDYNVVAELTVLATIDVGATITLDSVDNSMTVTDATQSFGDLTNKLLVSSDGYYGVVTTGNTSTSFVASWQIPGFYSGTLMVCEPGAFYQNADYGDFLHSAINLTSRDCSFSLQGLDLKGPDNTINGMQANFCSQIAIVACVMSCCEIRYSSAIGFIGCAFVGSSGPSPKLGMDTSVVFFAGCYTSACDLFSSGTGLISFFCQIFDDMRGQLTNVSDHGDEETGTGGGSWPTLVITNALVRRSKGIIVTTGAHHFANMRFTDSTGDGISASSCRVIARNIVGALTGTGSVGIRSLDGAQVKRLANDVTLTGADGAYAVGYLSPVAAWSTFEALSPKNVIDADSGARLFQP